MKITEIRNKTTEEINKDVKNLKEELQRLRFRKVTDELEDHSVIRSIRKDIARFNTILREREIKNVAEGKTGTENSPVQMQSKKEV
jgi:large subunit ribosomal protein L29